MKLLRRLGAGLERVGMAVLNARYSVSSWLWAVVSLAASLILVEAVFGGATAGLTEFDSALPINLFVWTLGLFVSELVLLFGMIIRKKPVVRYAALPAFVLWTAGAMGFLLTGNGSTLILLALPLMIFHAHMFISSLLRDSPQI